MWGTCPCYNCGRVQPCSGPLWGSQSERVQWMASSSFQERRLPYGISLCGFSNHSQFWNQNHTGHIESLCPASSSYGWISNQLQKTWRWASSKETPSFALHFISVLKDSPCTLKEGFPSPSVILNPKWLNMDIKKNFFSIMKYARIKYPRIEDPRTKHLWVNLELNILGLRILCMD